MILVTGGSFQGKTEFVKSHFGLADNDIYEGTQPFNELKKARCIRHFEDFIRNNSSPENLVNDLLSKNPDVIILITEIGCGIIPIEKSERLYREAVGRTGCFLAKNADAVVRLICGIPTILKGELP